MANNGMLGLSSPNPFLGDLLSGAGAGLLGLASHDPNAWLYAGQAMQGAQQNRYLQHRNDLQDQMAQQTFQMAQDKATRDAAEIQRKQQAFNLLLPKLPPEMQGPAATMGPDFVDEYAKQQVGAAFPKPTSAPGSVQEYEYAKQQGFGGSMLDYEKQKAEAGRAPLQPQQPPADVQEYQFAKSQGFNGSYMDYQASKKGQGMSVTLPDGTVMQVGGAVKPPTESQQATASRAQLIQSGMGQLEKLYTDPNISSWNVAGAETMDNFGPFGKVIAGNMRTDQEQQFNAAKAAALEGLAASVTGAGVAKDQFTRYESMLPALTDKPETRIAKLKAANDYLNVLLSNAGAAAQPVMNNQAPQGKMPQGALQSSTGPRGTVYLFQKPDGSYYWGAAPGQPASSSR